MCETGMPGQRYKLHALLRKATSKTSMASLLTYGYLRNFRLPGMYQWRNGSRSPHTVAGPLRILT